MRLKKEFPITAEKEYKAFKKSFKKLMVELTKIDPVVEPQLSHELHQAIFYLPFISTFGDEVHIGNLHFNDYHDLVSLANTANDVETKQNYFTQALEQLSYAKECYKRAGISKKKKEQFIAIVDSERQFVTNFPVEELTPRVIEEPSISSDEQLFESVDVVDDNAIVRNHLISSFSENRSNLFFVSSVPPKKRQKFEKNELFTIKQMI